MSAKNQDITLAKLETIADTTKDAEVRVLARTVAKYIQEHEKAHRAEVKKELGFVSKKGAKS